jgi:hypothetical protein
MTNIIFYRETSVKAVGWAEPRPLSRSLVDGELLAQGQVHRGRTSGGAEDEGKEPEQVENEGDHERRLWPDRGGESMTYWPDDLLAKTTS